MSKRLFLIRHGKAAAAGSGQSDFTRMLTESGAADAKEMAARLAMQNHLPQGLISSPAMRALSTAKCFAEIWQLPVSSIKTDVSIYESEAITLLALINNLEDSMEQVAIFGHNPGITDIANYLLKDQMPDLPTSGVVVIDFHFDNWSHVSLQTGELVSFDYPKSTF
jgi:phosphohistidine phosphatase